MIKKLRKKFIISAMISVAVVLILIIGTINIINYNNVLYSVDARIDMIIDNGGSLNKPEDLPQGDEKDNPPELTEDQKAKEVTEDQKKPTEDPGEKKSTGLLVNASNINAESLFDTRYFTVTLDEDGNLVDCNTDSIAAVSSDQAYKIASKLYDTNKTVGNKGDYRYKTLETDQGLMYIFVDCSRDMNSFKNFLIVSATISLLGLILVYILVMVISKMIVKPVAESYEKQKQFITDASHELKTPLAIIDADTEVLEMELDEDSQWINSIRSQTARLSSLTEKLVLLSRMEEGTSSQTFEDVNLSKLADEVCQSFDGVALHMNKKYSYQIQDDIHLNGDAKALTQMLSLLIDNAMKYSDDEGNISLKLNKNGKRIVLEAYNTVDSIEPGKHQELFDRFVRRDSSRNSKTGGSGIGLSVVAAVVNNHKGKVTCQADDDKSILFKIIF